MHTDTDDQSPACHLCGRSPAVIIGHLAWCDACAHARGSCCAEAEMDEPFGKTAVVPDLTEGSGLPHPQGGNHGNR